MPAQPAENMKSEIEAALETWKGSVLGVLYRMFAVVGLLGIALQVVTEGPASALLFIALYAVFLGVGFAPRLRRASPRARALVLLAVLYIVALISMARGGLVGDGRLMLMLLPVAALLLADRLTGLIFFALNLLTLALFAGLSAAGQGESWLIEAIHSDPFSTQNWIIEGLYSALIFAMLYMLVSVFQQFHVQLIATRLSAQQEATRMQVELEDSRQTSANELAVRALELKIRLEEAEQARDALDGALRARARLISSLGHDLRTPLGAVDGLAGLLEEQPLTESQKELAGLIRSSAQAMAKQVDDLLEFNRIESGRLALDEKQVCLEDLVSTAVESARALQDERPVTVGVDLDPGLPGTLVCDEQRAAQVITDVLDAALRLADAPETSLSVSPGPRVSAPGIRPQPPALLFTARGASRHLTDAFLQRMLNPLAFREGAPFDLAEDHPLGHSGLGLSAARLLAEKMGGELSASQEGVTFTFTLRLPARPPVFETPPSTQAEPSPASEAPRPPVEEFLPAEPEPPVLDPSELQLARSRLGEKGGPLLAMLVERFNHQALALLDGIEACAGEGSPAQEAARLAAQLKDHAAAFGAMRLSRAAAEIESAAAAGQAEKIPALALRARVEHEQARAALAG